MRVIIARKVTTPPWGWSDTFLKDLDPAERAKQPANIPADQAKYPQWNSRAEIWYLKQIEDSCIDPPLRKKIADQLKVPGSDHKDASTDVFALLWVDYILTTANSWKGPIKEFDLIVERPISFLSKKWYASFCWDGSIQQPDQDHFVAHKSNFVPRKELHVAFLGLEPVKSGTVLH
jgi:Domain of unknown function (DUF4424)